MNVVIQQSLLEGQHRGQEEMVSTLEQSEQFAYALYREGVMLQEEYIEQMSLARHQFDTLHQSWTRAEAQAPMLVGAHQTSITQGENAAREAGEYSQINQRLETVARNAQNGFNYEAEVQELVRVTIVNLREELRLHQQAAATEHENAGGGTECHNGPPEPDCRERK